MTVYIIQHGNLLIDKCYMPDIPKVRIGFKKRAKEVKEKYNYKFKK